jgi:hypothetical protein
MEILFPLMIITVIAELIISGRWVPFYFRTGIPLFRKSFHYNGQPAFSPESLSGAFTGGIAVPLIFHSIGPNEIAFREKFFSLHLFSYTPVMHGVIRVSDEQRQISVTGYANWSPLVFSAIFIYMDVSFYVHDVGYFPLLFLFVFWIVLYLIQFARFSKVFRILERTHSQDSWNRGI